MSRYSYIDQKPSCGKPSTQALYLLLFDLGTKALVKRRRKRYNPAWLAWWPGDLYEETRG